MINNPFSPTDAVLMHLGMGPSTRTWTTCHRPYPQRRVIIPPSAYCCSSAQCEVSGVASSILLEFCLAKSCTCFQYVTIGFVSRYVQQPCHIDKSGVQNHFILLG